MPTNLVTRLQPIAWGAIDDLDSILTHYGEDIPFVVELETNSVCTKACSYCPRPQDESYTLDEVTYKSVIDQLKEWGFKGRVSPHSFNEPLTDSRLLDLLSYTHEQLPKSEIVLFTNGDLLTEEKVDELVDVGVSRVVLSLHDDPSTVRHEARLNRLNERYNIIELHDRREGLRDLPLSTRGGEIAYEETSPRTFCRDIYKMIIRASGDVVLCCEDAKRQHVYGNVHETPVQEIWNDAKFKFDRAKIKRQQFDLPLCQGCGYEVLN